MTRSPGWTRWAAAPLMPITPEPRSAGDHVGLQARPVGDVHDRHLLAGEQIGGLHQILVDGDRAHVVQIGLGDRGAVDLRLEHVAREHQLSSKGGVVDEPGGPDPGRDQEPGRARRRRCFELRVAELEIVDVDPRQLAGRAAARTASAVRCARTASQRPRQAKRQTRVPRRTGSDSGSTAPDRPARARSARRRSPPPASRSRTMARIRVSC